MRSAIQRLYLRALSRVSRTRSYVGSAAAVNAWARVRRRWAPVRVRPGVGSDGLHPYTRRCCLRSRLSSSARLRRSRGRISSTPRWPEPGLGIDRGRYAKDPGAEPHVTVVVAAHDEGGGDRAAAGEPARARLPARAASRSSSPRTPPPDRTNEIVEPSSSEGDPRAPDRMRARRQGRGAGSGRARYDRRRCCILGRERHLGSRRFAARS